jgi:hypothetical protein
VFYGDPLVTQLILPPEDTQFVFQFDLTKINLGLYRPYRNTTRSIAPRHYFTDETSCALDAFNLAVGQQVLQRPVLEAIRISRSDAYKYKSLLDGETYILI